jgi:hypothetical protein
VLEATRLKGVTGSSSRLETATVHTNRELLAKVNSGRTLC